MTRKRWNKGFVSLSFSVVLNGAAKQKITLYCFIIL
jgi:hypothetical protein